MRADGELVYFGRNDFGQCDVPADLGSVVAIAAGALPTCAARGDGELVCFGRNDCGQCNVPADLRPGSGSRSKP